ncbi:MAG TPA: metallophosphoesterase [Thermoanaerobaculia bacterium]|nr:metallophosphoesterase [Thermoanaerobaculia bacterium]
MGGERGTAAGGRRAVMVAAAALAVWLTAAAGGGAASALGASAPPPGPVTIGVIGDQTLAADLDASYRTLARAVEVLAARRPDVVLHTGDLLESSRPPAEVRAQWQAATGLLDRLPAPWFLAAGDHDVNPPAFRPGSPDRSRERLFQELYAAREPRVRERLWYSFDVAGVHFVALHSQQTLHADPRWGNVFLARVGEDQLAWLARDLAAHAGARATVVFLHQPLWLHWSGWRPVHELLRRHRVAAVVAGHLHHDQSGGTLDGIEYLVVGAAGGATKEGGRDAGAVHHVTLLRVGAPGGVEIELLPLDGGGPLSPTPRADAERVQALDVQLGELWDFSRRNPVFLRRGGLVADCATGEPARLTLDRLGNPTDLPLRVEIALAADPPAVRLAGAAFAAGACAEPAASLVCTLPPSARVLVANPSTVTVDPAAPPLWTATLGPAGAAPPPPGTELRLTVRTAIDGDSGELFLTRTATTAVHACR